MSAAQIPSSHNWIEDSKNRFSVLIENSQEMGALDFATLQELSNIFLDEPKLEALRDDLEAAGNNADLDEAVQQLLTCYTQYVFLTHQAEVGLSEQQTETLTATKNSVGQAIAKTISTTVSKVKIAAFLEQAQQHIPDVTSAPKAQAESKVEAAETSNIKPDAEPVDDAETEVASKALVPVETSRPTESQLFASITDSILSGTTFILDKSVGKANDTDVKEGLEQSSQYLKQRKQAALEAASKLDDLSAPVIDKAGELADEAGKKTKDLAKQALKSQAGKRFGGFLKSLKK